jgi:hypothetical protein
VTASLNAQQLLNRQQQQLVLRLHKIDYHRRICWHRT